jgi:phosphomannomutase
MASRMGATPPPEIFKAYDIRGLYGEQIDGEIAERIGRAFARGSPWPTCGSASGATCA